ncbi:MAG: hypothetical protein N2561_09920 [Bacteroidetes bacterium]|nr:hypothetical protein [Rhodothermia bacterium]MCS7155248.1 hypothetical protein [Bacteroidota bacterium]MCX7907833.1 hypothetical protein [Bacteroidota bacterium]MDW8138652.1 hypothetical protein [Bacteroidota bacterium]MDW8284762.1 hypothetical protein [Bacteroidota bacterium]
MLPVPLKWAPRAHRPLLESLYRWTAHLQHLARSPEQTPAERCALLEALAELDPRATSPVASSLEALLEAGVPDSCLKRIARGWRLLSVPRSFARFPELLQVGMDVGYAAVVAFHLLGYPRSRYREALMAYGAARALTGLLVQQSQDRLDGFLYVSQEDADRFPGSLELWQNGLPGEPLRRLLWLHLVRLRELYAEAWSGLRQELENPVRRAFRRSWLEGLDALVRIETSGHRFLLHVPEPRPWDRIRLFFQVWMSRTPR